MSDTTILLPRAAAFEIHDGESLYYGGDQEWYPDRWQRQAGCGPTSCSNLLWYLAQTQGGCAPLCPYNAAQKPGFIQLMADVWHYVTPGNMGVNSTDIFAKGAERYGKDKGIFLKATALPVAPIHNCTRDSDGVFAFLAQSLRRELPVAFLNLSNGTLQNLDSWHWVTLVALRGGEAQIYDQGKALWIDLRQWLSTSLMGGGFVTVEAMAADA